VLIDAVSTYEQIKNAEINLVAGVCVNDISVSTITEKENHLYF
jgi:hypothetical protein